MYCRECGKPLLESDKFCSNCGTPVKKIEPAEEPMFRTGEGTKPSRTKTAPLPRYTEPAPAEEPKGERMIFEAIGDSIKWDTDIFPDKTPKKTEDVNFHWNLSEDEFRNRPVSTPARSGAANRREPSLWTGMEDSAQQEKSTGLKPSDTNSWDELFEGTRADDKSTRQAPGVGRSSIEAYWEDMFRRDGAVTRESRELPEKHPHRISISRDDISRGIGDEGAERLDQNKLEETMTLSREEVEGALRDEKTETKETRENREVAELASLAAAGIGAGPTFVPEGVDAVILPEEKKAAAEVSAEEAREITGEELEQELFREMQEPMTEAQKMRARQTEKIDKFYTFNKKNEEFQKLLDQEYERFKKSREEDDLGADLYKLGDEDFFEDHSKGASSQVEEMVRARQTLFHTDEFADLKQALRDEPAGSEEAETPAGEMPEAPAEEPEAEEVSAASVAAAAAAAGSRREKKQKKSLFGKLFGRGDEEEIEEEPQMTEENAEEPAAVPEEPVAEAEEPVIEAEEPVTEPEEPIAEAEEPVAEAEEPVTEPEEPAAEPEEPAAEQEEPAAESEEESAPTASIVFEPEEEEPVVTTEPAETPAPAGENQPEEPAAESDDAKQAEEEPEEPQPDAPAEELEEEPAEAPAAEEEPDLTKTASIVFEPEKDEPIVTAEPAEEPAAAAEEPQTEASEEAEEIVPRTTEPTRVYEKGDIPSPTTEEERASEFEESRAEAWDAFFSDDEDVNAGNTFDAEEKAPAEEGEKRGASIAASILAVILVILLALIVVRLVMPDSIISIKLDQITEKILHLFHSGMAGSLLHHIM